MKRLCLFLTRLYPPSWRRRYDSEYREMVAQMRNPGIRDAADILFHAAAAWLRGFFAPTRRPAPVIAAALFLSGAACAVYAAQGGLQLWRATALFLVLATLLLPVAAVTGFLATRHSRRDAIRLVSASLLIPALGLWLVAWLLALAAPPYPFHALRLAMDQPGTLPPVPFSDLVNARETLQHWGQASLLMALLTAPFAWALGWCGGWLSDRLHSER